MKNILMVGLLICGLDNNQRVLHTQQLLYIKSYPIKTEDGCSFFSNSEAALAKKDYLLIINNKQTAYIQVKNNTFLYFSKTSRLKSSTGYTDIFNGKSGSFKLVINNIKKVSSYSTKRNGMLYLNTSHIKEAIPIYGVVEDNDYFQSTKEK